MSSYPPQYAYPSAPPLQRARPKPVRLHWILVLLFNVVTLGLFGAVWLLVQSLWAKKISGRRSPFVWAVIYLVAVTVMLLSFFSLGIVEGITQSNLADVQSGMDLFWRLVFFVLYVGAAFTLKGVLEAEPIDIPLSGVMVFFFGPVYFQFHLQDYDRSDSGFEMPSILTRPGWQNAPQTSPQIYAGNYPPGYTPHPPQAYPPNHPEGNVPGYPPNYPPRS
ncbi:MAG TPA: DUF3824 domain-containing protein [Acidobacteriaceae bacterium]|jgi:hypothetical protein